jgi:hypothetical protein
MAHRLSIWVMVRILPDNGPGIAENHAGCVGQPIADSHEPTDPSGPEEEDIGEVEHQRLGSHCDDRIDTIHHLRHRREVDLTSDHGDRTTSIGVEHLDGELGQCAHVSRSAEIYCHCRSPGTQNPGGAGADRVARYISLADQSATVEPGCPTEVSIARAPIAQRQVSLWARAQNPTARAAGGLGAPVTLDRWGEGPDTDESGLATSSSDFPSAATPKKISTMPPTAMTPAPIR